MSSVIQLWEKLKIGDLRCGLKIKSLIFFPFDINQFLHSHFPFFKMNS